MKPRIINERPDSVPSLKCGACMDANENHFVRTKNQLHFTKLVSGIVLFLGICIFNGCSKTGSSGTYGGGSNNTYNNSSGSNVTIQNFSFTSSDLHITKGTTVVWTNKDNITHTVTADDGSFTSGNIAPGSTYSRAFTVAATVHYHCSIHTYMTGDVVVQ